MKSITPTNLRKNMFKVLKDIANANSEIEVMMSSKNGLNDGVVMISKREWKSLQEELYLQWYIGSCFESNGKRKR